MSNIDRREFLKAAGLAAGALAATGQTMAQAQSATNAPAPSATTKPARRKAGKSWSPSDPAVKGQLGGPLKKKADRGPNETIRIGVIGIHGRGTSHIRGFEEQDGSQVVAICDVDEHTVNVRGDEFDELTGRKVNRYTDLRKMFEDKSIDAVSIATPNHWHTLAAIWAMQAGKDVYVEKPCSHNVWEGRQLVKAARRYNKMCQHGTQSRSSPAVQEGIRQLRDGVIGEVYMARGLCFKWRDTIGKCKDEDAAPKGVNYDLWLGPAPERKYNKNRYLYNWHWNWDYGNGDIGNQGVHEMDLARWALGVQLPSRIDSMGGRFMWDDDKQVPNSQIACFHYPEQNKVMTFEVRHWIGPHEEFGSGGSGDVGVIVLGSKGYMALYASGYRTYLGQSREPGPSRSESGVAWPDFLKAVRSRKIEDLSADAEDAHLSAAHCHLANIAYRVQRSINFDPDTETIKGDREASTLLSRNYRIPYVVPADL